jgi:hypothetical protein
MTDQSRITPPTPPKGGNAPHPDSIPKLPKTIFNLEKKGGSDNVGAARRTEHK